jgi:hypothetical protein
VTLALQFAMEGEAKPFLARGVFAAPTVDPLYGFQFHEGRMRGGQALTVAIAGAHPRFGVDSIGTIAASLLTHALLSRGKPSRIINAGTAGGFEARGGVPAQPEKQSQGRRRRSANLSFLSRGPYGRASREFSAGHGTQDPCPEQRF